MKQKHTILIFVVTPILLYLLLPIFVKPIVKNLIKDKAGQSDQVNNLTINNITKFPNWQIRIQHFEHKSNNDSVNAEGISIIISPFQLFNDTIDIKEAEINKISVHSSHKKGAVTQVKTQTKSDKVLKQFRANNIKIASFNMQKIDSSAKLKFLIKNTNIEAHRLKNRYILNSTSENINISYDNLNYLNKNNLTIKSSLIAVDNNSYIFDKGQTYINDHPVEINGSFSFNKNLSLDISYKHNPTSLKEIISKKSNLPLIYNYIENGFISANGSIKGTFADNNFPVINYEILVDSLSLNKELQNKTKIEIHEFRLLAKMSHPSLDSMKLIIDNAKILTNDKEALLNLTIANAFQNPDINTKLTGQLDLASLNLLIPTNSVDLFGTANIDLAINGNYNDFNNSNYSNITSTGTISTSTISISNKYWAQALNVKKSQLILNNNTIEIKDFKSKYGQSDLTFSGQLSNILRYIFNNENLQASIELNSNYLNLNQLLAKRKNTSSTPKNTQIIVHKNQFSFPEKLNLTIKGKANHILFDQMNISDFEGTITMTDNKLALKHCNANLLNGNFALNGIITEKDDESPTFNGNLKLNKIDFRNSYKQLRVVQKALPIAQYSSGKFSADLQLETILKDNWQIKTEKLISKGTITTHDIVIKNKNILRPLSSVVKIQKIKQLAIDDFTADYQYKNETLTLFPFSTQIANQTLKLNGTYHTSGTMDFQIDAKVDKDILSNKIQDMIRFIPGNDRIQKIDVGAHISGNQKNPKVEIDYDKIRTQVLKQIKTSSPKELEDAAKNLFKQLFK